MRRWSNPVDYFFGSAKPAQNPVQRRRRNPAATYRVVAVDPVTQDELLAVYFVAQSANEAENLAAQDFGERGLMFAGYKAQKPTGPASFDLFLYFRPLPVIPRQEPPPSSKPKAEGMPSPVDFIAPPTQPAPAPPKRRGRPPTPAGRTCAVCGKSGGSPAGEALAALGFAPENQFAHPACLRKAQAQREAPVKRAGMPSPVDYVAPPPRESPEPFVSEAGAGHGAAAGTGTSQTRVLRLRDTTFKILNTSREWSDAQKDVFWDVQRGRGSTQVIARAGSGKTTTIMESLRYLPPGKSAILCAFNRTIKNELIAALDKSYPTAKPRAVVKTINSLGFGAVLRAFPGIVLVNPSRDNPDDETRIDKTESHIRALFGKVPKDLYQFLHSAVPVAKSSLATTPESLAIAIEERRGIDYPDAKSLEVEDQDVANEKALNMALEVLKSSTADRQMIDFDDQWWYCLAHNLKLWQSDYVFVDEAQDLNKAQIELVMRACKRGGRIISVGDPAQAIYGWRGADRQAIPNIVAKTGAKELYLSVSYRCAQSVIREAQTLVPDIEYAPGAPEGVVASIMLDRVFEMARPGDFVLSRTNQPMISACFALINRNIPARIQGTDVGKMLAKLITDLGASTVPELLAKLDIWEQQEVDKILKWQKHLQDAGEDTDRSAGKVQFIADKAACVRVFCSNANSIDEILLRIQQLFVDGTNYDKVMLSSIHKAKGLERDRVFLFVDTFIPQKDAAAQQEEDNLRYVAITRARKELYYVSFPRK